MLNCRNHLKSEEIQIKEGDQSKRLDQETLEKYWMQRSQGPRVQTPFWVNADGVVQQIIHQGACPDAPISPSPSPLRIPSLLCNELVSSSPPSTGHVTMSVSTTTSTELESGNQAPQGPHTPLSELSQSGPAGDHREEWRPKGRVGKPSEPCSKVTKGTAGLCPGKSSGITKRFWRPEMGLRSRKVTKFYELARNGSAIIPGQRYLITSHRHLVKSPKRKRRSVVDSGLS